MYFVGISVVLCCCTWSQWAMKLDLLVSKVLRIVPKDVLCSTGSHSLLTAGNTFTKYVVNDKITDQKF